MESRTSSTSSSSTTTSSSITSTPLRRSTCEASYIPCRSSAGAINALIEKWSVISNSASPQANVRKIYILNRNGISDIFRQMLPTSFSLSSRVPRTKPEQARLQIEGLHAQQNPVTACHADIPISVLFGNKKKNGSRPVTAPMRLVVFNRNSLLNTTLHCVRLFWS